MLVSGNLKKRIDWKRILNLSKQIKSKNNFDIIVPVSGGKDSCYVAYNLKYKYQLNPLFVTVNPPLQTKIGKKNIQIL